MYHILLRDTRGYFNKFTVISCKVKTKPPPVKVTAGSLVKIERGIYSDSKEYVPGEGIVQKKYPNAVFTMESAFFYHRLTDVVPDTYSIATPARTTAIAVRRIKQYFVPEGTLEIG